MPQKTLQAIGTFAEVAEVGDQGYLVSSRILGGVVIVYDAFGHYGREMTREGEGPGELLAEPDFAVGTGGIIMREPGQARLHLFSHDLSFQKTLVLPGIAYTNSVQSDPLTEGWLVTGGGFEDREDTVFLLDQEADILRTMPGETSARGLLNVIRGSDGTIWSAGNWGLVEVTDVRPALDGAGAWVFVIAPEKSLAELSLDDMGRRIQDGTLVMEHAADAFVYWVDLTPKGLELRGRDRFDTLVRPLGYGDLAYDIVETPDGNRRVRVGRLRFTRGQG